jgi:hypothetical protein
MDYIAVRVSDYLPPFGILERDGDLLVFEDEGLGIVYPLLRWQHGGNCRLMLKPGNGKAGRAQNEHQNNDDPLRVGEEGIKTGCHITLPHGRPPANELLLWHKHDRVSSYVNFFLTSDSHP